MTMCSDTRTGNYKSSTRQCCPCRKNK